MGYWSCRHNYPLFKVILTLVLQSTCYIFGFTGFPESFSDVAQNIPNAPYKEWVGGQMG